MPEVKIKAIKTVILTLTEEEATWLRNLLQNPLNGVTPITEDPIERNFRISFFAALKDV